MGSPHVGVCLLGIRDAIDSGLVEDVIEPSLFDTRGTVCMEGTPGPVCAGYWFHVTGTVEDQSRWTSTGVEIKDGDAVHISGANWSCHRWSRPTRKSGCNSRKTNTPALHS